VRHYCYATRYVSIERATMDKHIEKMIDNTIYNLAKAKELNNPIVAQAVLVNLQEVLPSYIDALASVNA